MTSQDFPYNLNIFNRPKVFDYVPGQPHSGVYGMAQQGLEMPADGACYVVELNPVNRGQVRVIAYCDNHGRVFKTDAPLSMPPARTPDLQLFNTRESNGTEGVVERSTGSGPTQTVCRVRFIKSATTSTVNATSIESALQGDPAPLFQARQNHEFMSLAYLAFCEFAPSQAKRPAYNIGRTFERFDEKDLFSAMDEEVLEAEQSWQSLPGIEQYLVRMLREEGMVGLPREAFNIPWEQLGVHPEEDWAPSANGNLRLIRTRSYADVYYIDYTYRSPDKVYENGLFATDAATSKVRSMILGTEGALNRFLLLYRYLSEKQGITMSETEGYCAQMDQWLIDRICTQMPDPRAPKNLNGLWDVHMELAKAFESLVLPYRIAYEFTSAKDGTIIGIDMGCPTADMMPKSTWNPQANAFVQTTEASRNGTAARYAAHLVILVCALAFAQTPNVSAVYVNAKRTEPDWNAIITGCVNRDAFTAAYAALSDTGVPDPFGFLQSIGVTFSFGESYRLNAVEPAFVMEKGVFEPSYEGLIDRDETVLNQEAQKLLQVRRACDLNIYEEGDRRYVARKVVEALDEGGVDAAVDALKTARDKYEDPTISSLCDQAIEAFELQTLDETSYLEIRNAFEDFYGFKATMTYARSLYENDDPSAIGVLEELGRNVENVPGFADTDSTCHRFFNSYGSRALYSKHCSENAAGRTVLPDIDERFLSHDLLSRMYLDSVANQEDAVAHAQKMVEIAPSCASSYLRLARAYYMIDNYEQEIHACAKAIELSYDAADTCLALYWAAYAFWQIEKYNPAQACYLRCIQIGASMEEQARSELKELVDSVKGLQRLDKDDQNRIMEAAGIPVGSLRRNDEFLMDAAIASTNSGAVALGTVLAREAMRGLRDDAYGPMVRSLEHMMK